MMGHVGVLWVFVLLSKCLALKFSVSPFKLNYLDILSGSRLLSHMFCALKPESSENCIELLQVGSPKLRRRMAQIVSDPDTEMILPLGYVIAELEINPSKARRRIFEYADLTFFIGSYTKEEARAKLDTAEYFPRIPSIRFQTDPTIHQGLFFATWPAIIAKMANSPALLSTRTICNVMGQNSVLGGYHPSSWKLVDGECFRGLKTMDQCTGMVRRLLIVDYSEMAGLGPAVRLLHLTVTLKYLEAVSRTERHDATFRVLQQHTLGVVYEYQVALAMTKNRLNEDQELKSVLHNTLYALNQYLNGSLDHFTNTEVLQVFLERLWILPDTFEKSRAILATLCMTLCSKQLDITVFTASLQTLLGVTSKELIPRRDIYTLLVMLANHRQAAGAKIATKLLWTCLGQSRDEIELLLNVNRANFAAISSTLAEDQMGLLKRFVRIDIMRKIKSQDLLRMIENGEYLKLPVRFGISRTTIKESLDIMLRCCFHLVLNGTKSPPLYLPHAHMHPFVEAVFWELLQMGLALKLRYNFALHPACLTFAFSPANGRLKTVKPLVSAMIQSEFFDATNVDLKMKWVFELDMMQMSQSYYMQIIGNKQQDHVIYRQLCRGRKETVLMRQWAELVVRGDEERYRGRLKSLARKVWEGRTAVPWYTKLLHQFPDSESISRLLFNVL